MMLRAPGTWIGVALRDASASETDQWRLPPGAAVIEEVRDGSPAWRVNLRARDVILEWDGEVVRSARDLASLIRDTPPGRTVTVKAAREGVAWGMSLSPEATPQTALAPPRTTRVSTWS
jgi:serine protease Do